ncbi:MAG: SAM-dependent methyltransferase [Actinomycetota bacterium]
MPESSNPDRFATHTGPGPRTNWVAWHEAYDSASGSMTRRLERVRVRVNEVLRETPIDATVLSLCAGDGRDLLGAELLRRPGRAVLIELDPELARRAAQAAAVHEWAEVRRADATDTAAFVDVLPVELLMMCGILGNVDPADVVHIVWRCAGLLKPGGVVIWTRGGGDPDLRPDVRAAFVAAGFEELAFDGTDDVFGVGVSRITDPPPAPRPGDTLFEFVR